jgi:transketolase
MATMTTYRYEDLPRLLTRLTGDEKHDRSSLSTLDVLWVLYDRVLELDGFGAFDSRLGYHPDRVLIPGVAISSGSLGHGLPIAVGAALTGRTVYCLVGDGELDEGSNWEAVQWAGRIGLAALTAVVVDNHSSTYHWPGGVERRFELEGWTAVRADGRDHNALEHAFRARTGETPHVVVAEMK